MMKQLSFLFKYIKYIVRAQGRKAAGNQFTANLFTNILKDRKQYPAYSVIDESRTNFLTSEEYLDVIDYGAGPVSGMKKKRAVKAIALSSGKSMKYTRLLFRLVHFFRPANIIELGTSLGITTIAFAEANPSASITTLEGCPATGSLAKANFETHNHNNIRLITGRFDETLPEILKTAPRLDLVFFDGNHRKDPTIRYFNLCLPFAHENSVFIFDDIHWSKEMEDAWNIIRNTPSVSLTVDLFFLGLVFFRKDLPSQSLILRF